MCFYPWPDDAGVSSVSFCPVQNLAVATVAVTTVAVTVTVAVTLVVIVAVVVCEF